MAEQRGRAGVLSRDVGTQVAFPRCDWNTAPVPRRPFCFVVTFPKSSVAASFLLMHNFPISCLFSPFFFSAVAYNFGSQSEWVVIRLLQDAPTSAPFH